MDTDSQYEQLWVCALSSCHWSEVVLWSKLMVAVSSGYKYAYRLWDFVPCSKSIILGSLLKLWPPEPWAFDQVCSTRPELTLVVQASHPVGYPHIYCASPSSMDTICLACWHCNIHLCLIFRDKVSPWTWSLYIGLERPANKPRDIFVSTFLVLG